MKISLKDFTSDFIIGGLIIALSGVFIKNSKSFVVNQVTREGIRAGAEQICVLDI